MRIKIINKINSIPFFFNVIWAFFLLYQLIIRVPEFEKLRPDGASHFIIGILILTSIILVSSLLFILISNYFNKFKLHTDIFCVFIPVIFLIIFILTRL